MPRKPQLVRFNEAVLTKYQIYNSIFLTLPFSEITNTGRLLPLFSESCEQGYLKGESPTEIINNFFAKYCPEDSLPEQNDLLFRFIQFIERQVVLFDAIEDAAFGIVNNLDGQGTLRDIKEESESRNMQEDLKSFLSRFRIQTTLTAHPTQFYPGAVLGIITDLTKAIQDDDFTLIKKLLAQLGKTAFFNKCKPTPEDEAINLIWFLENIFYHSVGRICEYLQKNVYEGELFDNRVISLGFWPGGDRDGNPSVLSETTLKVGERLRVALLKNYYRDLRLLKRRLTFPGVQESLLIIERKLYEQAYQIVKDINFTASSLVEDLLKIRSSVIKEHQALFIEELDSLIMKIKIFGFHFATLDIRQDSRVHREVLDSIFCDSREIQGLNESKLNKIEKFNLILEEGLEVNIEKLGDQISQDTLKSIQAMRTIQEENGELGAYRYIISNTQNGSDVLTVYAFLKLVGWENPTVDIVPLFETVEDLVNAEAVMEELYRHPIYLKHLKSRGNRQTIMLGFSDGTKDGGYLMANWAIHQAKEKLTDIARKHQVEVVFFDGRGGPPARGGGKTHQFYASQGPEIENLEIQLTIQGQTISSNFGTLDSCQYNLEQLLSAGVVNNLFPLSGSRISKSDRVTLQSLADLSYKSYQNLKNHPKFMSYLEEFSTVKYYSKTNISSRPAKRGSANNFQFEDLRAIPFVGSWSQLKQNVPGFFGVGSALQHFIDQNEFFKVEELFNNSVFFRTLLENTMMSLSKSFFPLTNYISEDPEYSEIWLMIKKEYELTKAITLRLFGFNELMENTKAIKASIEIREKIVLPLVTIQQYAINHIRKINLEGEEGASREDVYEKMITRTLFGNINASRNSA